MFLYSWDVFFDSKDPRPYINYNNQFLKTILGSVYVKDSFFEGLSARKGGAICISSSSNEYKTLIENCLILSCHCTNENGGGIFFSSVGEFVIFKVYGFRCHTSDGKEGQFSRSDTSSGESIKNNVYCSSICQCGYHSQEDDNLILSQQRKCVFECIYGKHDINSVNTFKYTFSLLRQYQIIIFLRVITTLTYGRTIYIIFN